MSQPVPVRGSRAPSVSRPWPSVWHEPFRELETLWERMGQLFDAGWDVARAGGWQPLVDVEETDSAYRFEVELPGVKRDDITVEVRDHELVITGEIKEKERTGILRHQTRRTGSFAYQSTLPRGADTDKIDAQLTDGVLTVTVPKAEKSKPRTIEVK